MVTATAEDWLWFQLAMVDEDESGGLRALAEVLMSYGERHFEGPPNQRREGMWANVLLMCGQFERVGQSDISFLPFLRVFLGRRSSR